jgi:hypothetical protein
MLLMAQVPVPRRDPKTTSVDQPCLKLHAVLSVVQFMDKLGAQPRHQDSLHSKQHLLGDICLHTPAPCAVMKQVSGVVLLHIANAAR